MTPCFCYACKAPGATPYETRFGRRLDLCCWCANRLAHSLGPLLEADAISKKEQVND